MVRDFKEPNYIQCVAFDPRGEFIGLLPSHVLHMCSVHHCVIVEQ